MPKLKPAHAIGEPFPLKRNYYIYVVPFILILLVLLSGLLWFAFSRVTQDIYLEQAQIRADLIVESLDDAVPITWATFLKGNATPQDLEILGKIITEEIERQKLISVKVYDLTGTVIYDVDPLKIGIVETAPSLRQVIVDTQPTLLPKNAADGTPAYELYIPYMDKQGNLRAVFELYEEVGFLDTLLMETAVPAIAVPIILQILLMLVLAVLVRRAQLDIDQRTEAIGQLSHRLETFVSASALDAARNADDLDQIPSRKIICTLFHSDVRDFTSFAEDNPPERVVYFLNDLMTIQVEIITRFGGDVDKMIGDALLVRFEGADSEKRAIEAAKAILDSCHRASLSRGLGIGIYTGQVISGAIGPESRRDFTVIGDSVNMSARLCSEARVGEIVVDKDTVESSTLTDFHDVENIRVRGHVGTLSVRRWHISDLKKTVS